MKTFKNIVRNFFIISTIIGSAFTVSAQSSTRIYHDAEAFQLKGHVKECVVLDDYSNDTTKFSSNGAIIGYDNYKITRDNKGRLTSITIDTTYIDTTIVEGNITVEPYEYQEWQEFSWDKNRVIEYLYGQSCCYYESGGWGSGSTGNTYKYNNKGEVESMTSTYKVVEDVYFYSDYKYDDHGNWIERKVTTVYDGENKSEIETRTITYYE